jgi:hypothetical protein
LIGKNEKINTEKVQAVFEYLVLSFPHVQLAIDKLIFKKLRSSICISGVEDGALLSRGEFSKITIPTISH